MCNAEAHRPRLIAFSPPGSVPRRSITYSKARTESSSECKAPRSGHAVIRDRQQRETAQSGTVSSRAVAGEIILRRRVRAATREQFSPSQSQMAASSSATRRVALCTKEAEVMDYVIVFVTAAMVGCFMLIIGRRLANA